MRCIEICLGFQYCRIPSHCDIAVMKFLDPDNVDVNTKIILFLADMNVCYFSGILVGE